MDGPNNVNIMFLQSSLANGVMQSGAMRFNEPANEFGVKSFTPSNRRMV